MSSAFLPRTTSDVQDAVGVCQDFRPGSPRLVTWQRISPRPTGRVPAGRLAVSQEEPGLAGEDPVTVRSVDASDDGNRVLFADVFQNGFGATVHVTNSSPGDPNLSQVESVPVGGRVLGAVDVAVLP